MTGILQYLMQQQLPANFIASPVLHRAISKGAPIVLKHIEETAKYILIHGVTFSTAVGGALDTITINGMLYLSYRASGNISGSHWIPHIFEGGTCSLNISDVNLFGTVHYQFIKFGADSVRK